jgi:RHS repeat-associated protein
MTTYSYDRENRLISQNVDGNVTSFAYDGFGRKRRESRGVNPDVILNWDGDQMIVESSDLDPEAPSKAYYVADGVIYAENANLGSEKSRRDYAVDFLGSVTGLTAGSDASLSSVRRWSAYGKLLSGSSEPIGYFWTGNTGSRVYQSLGLNDNRARHYGRNIKQWITRDPLWPSELPYGYVNGNPVTRIDPNGEKGDCSGGPTKADIDKLSEIFKADYSSAVSSAINREPCCQNLMKLGGSTSGGFLLLPFQENSYASEMQRYLVRLVYCINCIETGLNPGNCKGQHGNVSSSAQGIFGFLDGTWSAVSGGQSFTGSLDQQLKYGVKLLCFEMCRRTPGCFCKSIPGIANMPKPSSGDLTGNPSPRKFKHPLPSNQWPYMPGGSDEGKYDSPERFRDCMKLNGGTLFPPSPKK